MSISAPRALAAAILTLFALATSAAGATTTEPLIDDPADDATGFVVASTPLPSSDTLDILTGDFSYDHAVKATSVVLRLKDLTAGPPVGASGKTFYVNFVFNGTRFFLNATQELSNTPTFRLGDFGGTNGGRRALPLVPVTGALDPAADTVTITLTDEAFAKATGNPVVVPGTSTFDTIDVLAQRTINAVAATATPTADTATASDSFYVPAPPPPPEG